MRHGESNSVILPHALAYNAPAAKPAVAALRAIFNGADPAQGLFDLVENMGAPTSLEQLGMPEQGIAEETVATLAYNPRAVDVASVRTLVEDAYFGRRPRIET